MMASSTATDDDATHERVEEYARPPSFKRVDPMQIWMSLTDQSDKVRLQTDAVGRQKRQMEQLRPPKEEPLWIRHREEHRLLNSKNALTNAFLRNISSGRFSDGRDAVRQTSSENVPGNEGEIELIDYWFH
jgi:hypothetical protein